MIPIRNIWILILAILILSTGVFYLALTPEKKISQEALKIEKKVFGYSVKEKPIEGYEIGDGTDTIFVFSAIHGDEAGTTDLLNQLVTEIKDNPGLVSTTKKLIVILIANPDAYYEDIHKFNANGVNLNLNFATSDWQNRGPEGTYAGINPFSEPESRAIKEIVEKYNPSIMIAYHAIGHLVTPENEEASVALGKWYAKKTGYHYYDDTNFEWDYPGTATKWFVETTGKPAITVELTSLDESDWEVNKKALIELISSDKISF